jgi:hypothetical protein
MLARLITAQFDVNVAAEISQLFFLSLFAFNHFMPQQQRARSVGQPVSPR